MNDRKQVQTKRQNVQPSALRRHLNSVAIWILVCLLTLTLIPAGAVWARPAPILAASYDRSADALTVTGQYYGQAAVAIVLLDSKGNTLLLATAPVDDTSFLYATAATDPRIALGLADGTYTVKVADYAGGDWLATTTFTVVTPAQSQEPGRLEPVTLGGTANGNGIYATDLSGLVAIPAQWETNTAKVEYFLLADVVTADTANFGFISGAAKTLQSGGASLLRTFNIQLMQRVTKKDGTVSESPVDRQYIRGNLTIRIPLSPSLASYSDLSIVYIDEQGQTASLATRRVTIDNKEYLEFANNHFSVYGIVTGDPNRVTASLADHIPPTGDVLNVWPASLTLLLTGIVLLAMKKRQRN